MSQPVATVFAAACLAAVLSAPAAAATVYWTDWMPGATQGIGGTLDIGGDQIAVGFSGNYSFSQVSGGTNYWSPDTPYLSSSVSNAPPASDIIALNTAGTVTITFSKPVVDPLLALVSWNGNVVDFGAPIEFLSFGRGYFGNGTPAVNADGDGFSGNGEVHGVLRVVGTYSSISFTHTSENWHGFTVGAMGAASPASGVPVPAPLALLGIGLAALAGYRSWRSR